MKWDVITVALAIVQEHAEVDVKVAPEAVEEDVLVIVKAPAMACAEGIASQRCSRTPN